MFTVTYGKQTFGSATDTVSIFALKLDRGMVWKDGKSTINSSFERSGPSHSNLADTEGFDDHGKWYTASYDATENGNVALCMQLTRRASGTIRAQCVLHIIPHDNGPMIRVRACITPHNNSVQGEDVTVFAGYGYVVDHKALTELGIVIPRADIAHFMDEEELEDEFTVENLSSGKSPLMPNVMRVEDSSGTVSAVIAASAPSRKMRIRKR